MSFKSKRETPLHRAVIENDLELVQKYRDQVEETNSLGFTPLEIANYLDRKKAASILSPTNHPVQFFKDQYDVNYIPSLKFQDYSSFKKVIKECPYLLRSPSIAEENLALGETYRDKVASGYVADVTIDWIDEEIGYGLFTNAPIKKGAYIGEYTGFVRRYRRNYPDPNGYCFHYPTRLWSLKYYMIDSLYEGNQLRFANHSDSPTLKPACMVDRGLLHLIFFTLNDLSKGEELTFNYGQDYWRKRVKQ